MLTSEKLTTTDVKRINKNRVFRLIHYSGKVARQELSDALDLSLPTVNQNLKLLSEEGLIEYSGNFESTGGRKAQIIMVGKSARVAVSVNLTSNGIRACLVGLTGEVIDEISLPVRIKGNDFDGNIANMVNKLIEKNSIPKRCVLGVGITVPGILDNDNKVILTAPTMGLKNYEVEKLTKGLKYKTIVINDARAHALADYWKTKRLEASKLINMRNFDEKKLVDNDYSCVYLMLNEGVGGAFLEGEKIKTGIHNRAGEIGHMTIHAKGKKCYCGHEGCFEAYVSSRNLSTDLNMTLDEFFTKLKSGDATTSKIFDEYLDNLAIGINNLYVINDSEVCICGPVADYIREYEDDLKERLIAFCPFETSASYLKFSVSTENEASLGAAIMFLIDFIASI